MPIRLGVNPIGWSNDDLRSLGGDTPLESCLADAHAIGYVGMELGHKFPRDPAALRAALDPFGLECISGWYSTRLLEHDADAEFAALRPHLDLLSAMGSDVLVVAETSNAIHTDRSCPLSLRPRLGPRQWGGFAARLTALADAVAAEGLRIAYHHHMGTIIQSEADIDALMAECGDAVGLLLDTGHATWGGADPARLASRHRGRIVHVHVKDVRREVMAASNAADRSFLESVLAGIYTVPGDGMVDFAAVFAALPDYDGWVVVEAEQDPAKADPRTYAALGYRTLNELLGGRMERN